MLNAKARLLRNEIAAIPLRLCLPEAMRWDMQEIQLAIARRAYELFETRHREHGHDWEDWFQAESELLRPVSIAIAEKEKQVSVRVNVLGFSETELRVSVEPKRILILGCKTGARPGYRQDALASDVYPDQIFRVIELPKEVEPEGAIVELLSGILKFELPKAAKKAS